MAIDVTAFSIQDSFGNAVTDFPLSNIGDKQTITNDITVSEYNPNDAYNNNYTNGMILV
jgi:hypothetical protein